MGLDDILQLETALQELRLRISATTEKRGDRWKHELIEYRRLLGKAVADLAVTAAAWEPPPPLIEPFLRFRNSLATLRAALALHQASFPVVAVETAGPDYLQSAMNLRSRYDDVSQASAALKRAARSS